MPRERYRNRLADLRADVTAMGETVVDRYETAVTVLESQDALVADRVIAGDAELNRWYLDIERECVRLLALEQPVASDLWFVTASFKIVTDLERVADLAVNIARYASEGGADAGGDVEPPVAVVPLATTAGEMVADAVVAYANEDVTAAREIAARDDDLDDACAAASKDLTRELLTASAEQADGGQETSDIDDRLATVTRTLLTIRDVERVGEHAVNVCARTLSILEHDDELIY